MPNSYFSFKQFAVHHDRCAMKVGTDGVLLGAWADVAGAQRMLDIGTGTGLIALMLAQRSDARITAIDIDPAAIGQAEENVLASPWGDRIEVLQADVNHFSAGVPFDVIVSNPPYFVDSLKCPDSQRNTARHTDTLTASSLFGRVASLLAPQGRFSLILPTDRTSAVVRVGEGVGLFLARHTRVVTRPGLPPKRSLLEFVRTETVCSEDTLVVELDRHVYSDEYKSLTRDFYLKF